MTKVWIAFHGEYEDRVPVAVCSNKKTAEDISLDDIYKVCVRRCYVDVEEFEIDAYPDE